MRVLFVTGEFPPLQGGVGDYTHELAKALAAIGVQVHVLTSVCKVPSAISHTPSAISIHPIVPQWNWSSLRTVRHALSVTRADILHVQYQTAAFGMHPAINLAPRLLNLYPFAPSPRGRGGWGALNVVTFHDLRVPYLFPKAGPLREWITFELARSSDAVIATNEKDRERLEGKIAKSVAWIPIGSNIAPEPPRDYDRAAWRARLGIAPNQVLLSYFGFLNESKGASDLIRALGELVSNGMDVKLVMVGGQIGASDPTNVAYLKQVKRLISEMRLDSRVLWTDYAPAPQVSANLLASDICVLPYRDGASFRRGTLMAALAHGLPVVTTLNPQPSAPRRTPSPLARMLAPWRIFGPVDRVRERSCDRSRSEHQERGEEAGGVGVRSPTLRDGENALLVPPENPRALADAIARVANGPALRAQLERGARELADRFSWDQIAAQHLELYRALLDE